jgi:hypothetical protein
MRLVSLVVLAACGSGKTTGPTDSASTDVDADTDTDVDTDTDTDADTDTDTTLPTGYPTSIVASCAATTNALRFDCEVTVDPPQAVDLRWYRSDGLGPERVDTSDLAEGVHAMPLYFLAPDQEYTVEATATSWPDGPRSTIAVTTAVPPLEVGTWLTMTGTSTMGLLGTEDPCSTGAIAVIYDTTTGDLVWYHDLDPSGSLGMLDMVRFTDRQTVIGETDGNVVEIDLTGADLVRFPVDYPGCCSLNHDIFEADGLYWSQYQNTVGFLTLDNIVVIDAYGVEQYQWNPRDHLTIPANAFGDYLHTNSEYVDANGDFYLSWLSRDAVGKFEGDRTDPNWGDSIWLMTGDGQPGDLGNDITIDWSAIAGPHEFGGQHNFHLRRDGRVMLLDNDNGRGLVLTVDEATVTATADAVYPTHENQCFAQGTAMDTLAGNAVVGCASEWVREYDLASSSLIWEAEIQCRNGGGGGFTSGGATRWYPLDGWQ